MVKQDCLFILTPGFPKDERDSTCLPFLQNFIQEINEQFPKLKLIIVAFDYPFIKTIYRWHDNEVFSFNGWRKRKLRKIFKWISVWTKMKYISRTNKVIGILSLWCGECALIGNRYARVNKLGHFCWIQGQDAKRDNKYVSRIKPVAGELIAISDYNSREFEIHHSIKPGYTIPVGIRLADYSQEPQQKTNDILGVGSLIPLKQYHLFIEVLSNIKKYFPEIKAVLSGKGPEEVRLKSLIGEQELNGNISLTGEMSHDKILILMKQSRIFLHTSNYEGLSVACIEALASGCQVISFLKPMQEEIKNWHVVMTMEEMVEKTISILTNNQIDYTPVFPFTIRKSVQDILELYNYNDLKII
jgi:glycosyltransferase involved in cell wall biosynthesis